MSENNIVIDSLKNSEVIIPKGEFRDQLIGFEEELLNIDGAFVGDSDTCPLKHSFSDNIYVREIFIPKNTLLTGKIHKHEHPNFLMSGEVLVITEDKGREVLKAPLSMISKAGTKRALFALTDLVWITVHHNPTNTTNLEELEQNIIAPTFEDFDNFIIENKGLLSRLKQKIIKKLLL